MADLLPLLTLADLNDMADCAIPATEGGVIPFNRELSWIEFNRRVLEEALDRRNPLLERVKFLAIFFTNLDEFFMIRVGGIKHQIAARVTSKSPDGYSPKEQLEEVHRSIAPLLETARGLLQEDLIPALAAQDIHILTFAQLRPVQRSWCSEYFHRQVFPVLTPLAIDPSHPFPHISNLSLNLAVIIRDDDVGELFARVKVPEGLPRLVPLPPELVQEGLPSGETTAGSPRKKYAFLWLEELIRAHLPSLFPGVVVAEAYPFRVTRNADLELEEDEAGDLLRTIEEGIRQRQFGEVVRLQVDAGAPERLRTLLTTNLDIGIEDVDTVRGPQGLGDLLVLRDLDRPDLKDPPISPQVPLPLRGGDLFAAVRQQDILLHHPYDSFSPVVEFIQAAATDPDVLAIKQTLYRVGTNSPIVQALMYARDRGKQVTVLVELKARFDEENNISWARALEKEGVHVVYGVVGLKTHAKMLLVVRREAGEIRRYVHLGTGNYNVGTSRFYTDLGLFTTREGIGADVSELFNYLTGHSRQKSFRKLLVAPLTLRARLRELIDREVEVERRTGEGRLIFKVNALVDAEIMGALYAASHEGVQIDLIVRGMCCLRPGVPGFSDRIRVRSIVGPFLEHSRIFYFRNGGQEEVYLGSADIMERNLNRRVETLFPLEDPGQVRHVRDVLLAAYLEDNLRARVLNSDGRYERLGPAPGAPVVDSQLSFRK